MSSRLVLRPAVLVLLVLTTVSCWLYVLQSVCSTAHSESDEMPEKTNEDPVISALRDVILTSDRATSDCRRLFSRETSAYNFSMSEDYRSNVDEFLFAVNASTAGARDVEGNSFQMETEYRLLHYLTSRLAFVSTVCETGMTITATDPKESQL